MPTPHNEASVESIAKTVLMPGDPRRSEFIAKNYLKDAVLVNNVRGVQGYTGTWKGVPVTVTASGLGMPAIGIYTASTMLKTSSVSVPPAPFRKTST